MCGGGEFNSEYYFNICASPFLLADVWLAGVWVNINTPLQLLTGSSLFSNISLPALPFLYEQIAFANISRVNSMSTLK